MAKKRRLRKTGALKAPEAEKVQSEVEAPVVVHHQRRGLE